MIIKVESTNVVTIAIEYIIARGIVAKKAKLTNIAIDATIVPITDTPNKTDLRL